MGKPVKNIMVTLVDQEGQVVRRTRVPDTTVFLVNLRDGHYYDRQTCCGRFVKRMAARQAPRKDGETT